MEGNPSLVQSAGMSAKRAIKSKPLPAVDPDRKSPTKFREWRKRAGLTQRQVADLLDVHESQISRVESGDSPYDRAYLEVFAQAYGCEPWQLLIQDPRDPAWLFKFLLSMPEADRKELFKIIQGQR